MPVLKETPSQTAGPYVHIGTLPSVAGLKDRGHEMLHVLADDATLGERIRIEGTIIDGAGDLVKDAIIEIWQASASGQFGGNEFPGWGRAATDFESGQYSFETIKPGSTPFHDGRPQAPHVTFLIFARGINIHLQTRMYFSDETVSNSIDPVLQLVGDPSRMATLIAAKEASGSLPTYRFDIRLQGEGETVFFDV